MINAKTESELSSKTGGDLDIDSSGNKISLWYSSWLGDGHKSLDSIYGNYRLHKTMLEGSSQEANRYLPIFYLSVPRRKFISSNNSLHNITAAADECYNRIDRQLQSLLDSDTEHENMEKGAVTSALTIVDHLRSRQLAPPEITWHGGDAIVMLWVLGDTTYAITVTDGEFGYVVRRNRREIKTADSIRIDAIQLADLR